MQITHLALAGILFLAPPAFAFQDPEPGPQPAPETVEEKLSEEQLRAIFALAKRMEVTAAEGSREEKLALIAEAREVEHHEICFGLRAYVESTDPEVRSAALEALRWMQHPSALDALLDLHRRRVALFKQEADEAALFRAIGQHESDVALKALTQFPRSFRRTQAVKAQILALGRIRNRKALQGLLQIMRRFGNRHAETYMPETRLSLMAITGLDKGLTPLHWARWWESNPEFRVPKQLAMRRKEHDAWDRYWEIGEYAPEHESTRDEKSGTEKQTHGSDG